MVFSCGIRGRVPPDARDRIQYDYLRRRWQKQALAVDHLRSVRLLGEHASSVRGARHGCRYPDQHRREGIQKRGGRCGQPCEDNPPEIPKPHNQKNHSEYLDCYSDVYKALKDEYKVLAKLQYSCLQIGFCENNAPRLPFEKRRLGC